MKNFILSILCIGLWTGIYAQSINQRKPLTIGLHFFYNDIATAQHIKANNLDYVLKNNLWSKPNNLQGGFGIVGLWGLSKKIDAVGVVNASWIDYQRPSGIFYGSNNFLLDINTGIHIKLFADNSLFDPFLITKVNFSSYKDIHGFSFLPGAGVQVNLFKEAFILTTFEYRKAFNNTISNQLYYSIGIATNVGKTKTTQPSKEKAIPAEVVIPPVLEEIKPVVNDVVVNVKDEVTGQPLLNVIVTLKSSSGNIYNGTTNSEGLVIFSGKVAGNYNVSGILNNIEASQVALFSSEFSSNRNQVNVLLTHNDPRFTLAGNTFDKSANVPVGNVEVTITNKTLGSTSITNSGVNGGFSTQLEAASDFVIAGKKSGHISNIENVSTMGLNRSAILYVKLQLGIEEATAGKNILLNKLFFETGKSGVKAASSPDLEKLIQFLKDNPDAKLEIQGYTDNTGNPVTNQRLSQQRAGSVINYLVKNRIEKERLTAKGFGSTNPVADNKTFEGRAQNRRVEMKIL